MPTTRPGYIWSGTEWVAIGQEAAVNPFAYQATAPTSPATGDIWIDSDETVNSIDSTQFLRWRKTMTGGQTSLSGTDDNSLPLQYTPGYEQLYINGVLQVRGQDYVATTGTTVTGLTALVANDTVEVFSAVARAVSDVYTQSQSDARFVNRNVGGLNLVVPTGATGGTVSANGQITFTNTSSITLDGVFTSTYQNYRLMWNLDSASASFYPNLQYRKAGTTNATAGSYLYSIFYMDCIGGFGAFANSSGATSAQITYGGRSGFPSSGSFDINNPMISRYTTLSGVSQTSYGTTTGQQLASLTTASTHLVNDTFDGFTITSSNGATFTGTIRIYGYNNGA